MRRLAPLVLLAACGGGDQPCDPTTEACTFAKDVSTITVGAGVEDEDTCQSWTLHNPTELWVNAISQTNDGAYHHANWFFVPDNTFEVPDGTWSCNDHDFQELQAALLGGYLFALSTQSHGELQSLPGGSAIRIPPYSRIIGSSHRLNASDSDVTTTMHLEIDTIPPTDVEAKLAPQRIQYHDLTIEAEAQSSFSTDCDVASAYDTTLHTPMSYQLYYVLFHYHVLGSYAELRLVGGPHDGELVARHDQGGENLGVPLDPPVDLAALGATGLRFTCGYDNPRPNAVGWGIGDQEMCVVALQAKTDLAFDGDVPAGTGAMTGTSGTGEIQHAGACSMLAFPWDFTKPGGTGP